MSLVKELQVLQWKQLQHDERYHKEICLLSVHHRINHMTLHFAKYSGQLINAEFESDLLQADRCCLDALIIATSTANILNIKLSSKFDDQNGAISNVDRLATQLALDKEITYQSLSRNMAIVTGQFAKTAESVDHLEAFPYRENLTNLTLKLFSLLLAGCKLAKTPESVENRIQQRMLGIEQKSIFFEQLGNYKDGY